MSLYGDMIWDSPIQKEECEDSKPKILARMIKGQGIEYRWSPRQEDLQEIFFKNGKFNMLDTLTKISEIYDSHRLYEDTFSEMLTVAWCLFVHKEVYGLEWNWKDKKWEKL